MTPARVAPRAARPAAEQPAAWPRSCWASAASCAAVVAREIETHQATVRWSSEGVRGTVNRNVVLHASLSHVISPPCATTSSRKM